MSSRRRATTSRSSSPARRSSPAKPRAAPKRKGTVRLDKKTCKILGLPKKEARQRVEVPARWARHCGRGIGAWPRDSAGFAPGLHHTPILIQAAKEKVPVRIVQMMMYLVTLLYQLSIFDYQLTMEMVTEGRRRRANYKWLCGLMCVGLVLNAFKFAVTCWLIREFLRLSFQR